jgi:hypothetical protein
MDDKLPWMPFYGVLFYEDEAVNLMSLEEEAMYLRLLWRQWREGSLPPTGEAQALLGRGPVSARVSAQFPLDSDGRCRNPKVESVRRMHVESHEKRAEAGKKGRAKQLAAKDSGERRAEPRRSPGDRRAGPGQLDKDKEVTTWLTPFADHWSRRCGNPPFGKLASVLGPLVKAHGAAETVARWSRYLDATEPKFCSVHRFDATFNSWGEPETVEMTNEWGAMALHRKDPATGEWKEVVA